MKNTVTMILAGGKGNRLGILTENTAKPAVSFGGKYRLIDFVLSSCAYSGAGNVGVLTQYRPLELNTYIGGGEPWGICGKDRGVFILPPYMRTDGAEWYSGTANAVYQNFDFIDKFHPDNVLILSGDHIYKMDYGKMLEYHTAKGADATIAVINVDITEASRFGIMNTDAEMRITDFEEKPEKPESTLASMGIYIFNRRVLREYLEEDNARYNSQNDFGKNIIPRMLENKAALFAYRFEGYWRDVGTVESYWSASMDLLKEPPLFNINGGLFGIMSGSGCMAPHSIKKDASVCGSIVAGGSTVCGRAEKSIISENVYVDSGAQIFESVIMPGAYIGKNARIYRTVVGSGAYVGSGENVGEHGKISIYASEKGVCGRDKMSECFGKDK